MPNTIDLSNHQPFASGYNRQCFRHPENPSLCLKILRPENIEARFHRQSFPKKLLGKRRIDDNAQELRAHQQQAIRRLISQGQAETVWRHLPRFHGSVQTSLGTANVSELLQDEHNRPAETLEQYLQRQRFDHPMQEAVERFCDWLQNTGILTRNLLPHNLVVVERANQPELYLVDGLGAPTIPGKLAIITAWRRRYIGRRIQRFYLRIEWELSDRPQSWEQSQKL
ncbi:YrbL family protein [Marinobacter sp. NP-4(2019)]|uniref:YrbL family protein n=1 Tax=Marinobacter sp. NP-4(2019) TaxID=2488665 RepID=UPI001D190C2B|nr:YrbL family protein [Marinobacter sp. NP-4(2019)]